MDSLRVELNNVKKEVSSLSTSLDEEKRRRQMMEQELKEIKEKLNFENYMSAVPESVFESDKEEKIKEEEKKCRFQKQCKGQHRFQNGKRKD